MKCSDKSNRSDVALCSRRVLVTGASGLVGRSLVPRLLAAGADVVSVCRRPPEWFDLLEAKERHKVVAWDLRDAVLPDGPLSGVTDIIHLAAVLFSADNRTLTTENRLIAENAASSAIAAPDCTRVLLASSLAARGPGGASDDAGEDGDRGPVSAYGESKLAAEQTFETSLKNGAALAILRIPVVLSDHDTRITRLLPVIRRAPALFTGALPARFSAIHVDDLADGFLAALATKAPTLGRFEIQHGADVDTADLFGRSSPYERKVGFALAKLVALGSETWSRATGAPPFLTRDKLREAAELQWCGCGRAFEENTSWRATRPPISFLREKLAG